VRGLDADVRFLAAGAGKSGRPLHVFGEVITCKAGGEETGGVFSVVEEVSPPDGGTPLHVHRREDEGFFVLEGRYEIRVGDRTITAEAGAFLFGPRGIPHRLRNAGDGQARVLVVVSPAGFEAFFEEVSRLSAEAPPAMDSVMALARRYGLEFL
jgi:mannose-6-phosphate isomerase-like protein (cupin superfamily)